MLLENYLIKFKIYCLVFNKKKKNEFYKPLYQIKRDFNEHRLEELVKNAISKCPESFLGSAAHFIYDFLCLRSALKNNFDYIVLLTVGQNIIIEGFKLL